MKSCMGFRFAYLHLNLTVSNGQGQDQGHAHFDNEYLGNDVRYGKHYSCLPVSFNVAGSCAIDEMYIN